jgi:hypothetical protein
MNTDANFKGEEMLTKSGSRTSNTDTADTKALHKNGNGKGKDASSSTSHFLLRVIVGASSARFAHSRGKQVSRESKCPSENLYGKPHQKFFFLIFALKIRT